MDDLLSVSEVAAIVGCSEQTVRIWITWGELRGINVSKRKRFPGEKHRVRKTDLEEFLKTRSTDKARGTPTREMPQTPEFLESVPPVMTIGQVAQMLDVSEETIKFWIRSGEITAINVSRSRSSNVKRYRIRHVDLDLFLFSRSTALNKGDRPWRRRPRSLPPVESFI